MLYRVLAVQEILGTRLGYALQSACSTGEPGNKGRICSTECLTTLHFPWNTDQIAYKFPGLPGILYMNKSRCIRFCNYY